MPDALQLNRDVFAQLPQQGPGDDASTERALHIVEPLGESPRILDIGCGSGRQTLALARLTKASITAIDLDVRSVAACLSAAGFSDRLEVHAVSMEALPFEDGSFDGIWSEGAIYNMGFDAGLRSWRRLLVEGGFLAVTELSWLDDRRPAAASKFWKTAYPGMGTRSQHLAEIEASGYASLADFVLAAEAWWTN